MFVPSSVQYYVLLVPKMSVLFCCIPILCVQCFIKCLLIVYKRKMATKSLICLEEYEEEARSILDRNAWGYYSSGATTEYTLRDNVQAYNR